MKPDPERIWLQNADDAKDQCEGRMWCEDKVWPDNPEDGEPTQYIRIDLYERALLDAHQRGRREGMEEAAKVAEIFHEDDDRMDRKIKSDVANAIRAKAQEAAKEGE